MLIGEISSQIDPNGRFKIPDEFMGFFMSGSVATCGLDGNVLLFPLSYWRDLVKDIAQLPFSQKASRSFRRFFFSSATKMTPDKTGQILLSTKQRQFAGIDQEIIIVGVHNYIEIWNVAAWNREQNQFIESINSNR